VSTRVARARRRWLLGVSSDVEDEKEDFGVQVVVGVGGGEGSLNEPCDIEGMIEL
jgi:hypothetical protein